MRQLRRAVCQLWADLVRVGQKLPPACVSIRYGI